MNFLLAALPLTVTVLVGGFERRSPLHICRNQLPSYCGEHVMNSICDEGSLECVCRPGFTLISRQGGTFCVEVLDWAKCRFDEDCVKIRHSICHPGAGRCICPRHLTYLPDMDVCDALSERTDLASLQTPTSLTSSGMPPLSCADFGAIQGANHECLCPPLHCHAAESRTTNIQTFGDVRSVLYDFCNAQFLQITTNEKMMTAKPSVCLRSNDSRAASGLAFLLETEAFQVELCLSKKASSRFSRDTTCRDMKAISSYDQHRLLCLRIRDPMEIRTLVSRGEVVLRSKFPSSSFPSLVLPVDCSVAADVPKITTGSEKSEKLTASTTSPSPSPSSVNSLTSFSKDRDTATSHSSTRCLNSGTVCLVAICFGSLAVAFFSIIIGWFIRILLKNRKAKQFQQALDSQS